ncbi:phosphopantetheine-binding protein [Streptomyces mirabilis]|uniref:phosphopantetheine-binding protein n=1 Tax=Streptomyces mirabilis TaxID=68239 RepID=UPI0033EAA0EC
MELEPSVERLLEWRLAAARGWLPHQFAPWGAARHPDAPLKGLDWESARSTLSQPARHALIINLLDEDDLPSFPRTWPVRTNERGQRRKPSRSEETGDPSMRQAAEGAAESSLPEELVALLTGHLNVKADVDELSDRTTFESLGLDSLSLMELVVAAEEEYGIVLPENALDLRPSSTLGEAARAFEHAH